MEHLISTGEMLSFLRKNGIKISHPGLIKIGKRENFIQKENDRYHWLVNKNKAEEYFKKPPLDYSSIKEISADMNISKEKIYNIIKYCKIPYKKFRGWMYVKLSDFVEKYKEVYNV